MPKNATLATTEIGGQPMDEIWMEVRVADGVQEEGVLDQIEGFSYIDSNDSSSACWLLGIETIGDFGDGREKSSGG